VAGIVGLHDRAHFMPVAETRAGPVFEGPELLAEPGVAVAVGVIGAILLPQQHEGHAIAIAPPAASRTDSARWRGPTTDRAALCPEHAEIDSGSPPTVPTTPANATMPSLTAAPTLSFRPARTRNRGRQSPPARSHEMKHCGHRNTSAEPSGDDGADTSAGAASRPRCIA
jgi:hypothetical protein